MKGPALTPASLRQRATWLRLDKINNPYSGVFDMAADTIEQLEAEVARLRGVVESVQRGNEAVSTCGGTPAALPTPEASK